MVRITRVTEMGEELLTTFINPNAVAYVSELVKDRCTGVIKSVIVFPSGFCIYATEDVHTINARLSGVETL